MSVAECSLAQFQDRNKDSEEMLKVNERYERDALLTLMLLVASCGMISELWNINHKYANVCQCDMLYRRGMPPSS